jgi:hypothetical protein
MEEDVAGVGEEMVIGIERGGRAHALGIVANGEIFIDHHRHHQHSEVALRRLELPGVGAVTVQVPLRFGPDAPSPLVECGDAIVRVQDLRPRQAFGAEQIQQREVELGDLGWG